MLLWILECMYLFKLQFSSVSDMCTGVGLLDHMVALFLVFRRKHHTVFPPTVYKGFLFSTPSLAFIICRFLMMAILTNEVIHHCSFHLHFSSKYWYWASFHVPVCYPYIIFREMCIQIFGPFFLIGLFGFFWY